MDVMSVSAVGSYRGDLNGRITQFHGHCLTGGHRGGCKPTQRVSRPVKRLQAGNLTIAAGNRIDRDSADEAIELRYEFSAKLLPFRIESTGPRVDKDQPTRWICRA